MMALSAPRPLRPESHYSGTLHPERSANLWFETQ